MMKLHGKIWQEFYCGQCQGYIRLKLNYDLNYEIEFVCPDCGHKHRRVIKDGVLQEDGRYKNDPVEEICPPKSAYSKEPWTKRHKSRRDGVPLEKSEIPEDRLVADSIMRESWFERFGGK